MIKFDVLNRFLGNVQFTAEIDCAADANQSMKIGLAVKWAIENKADLSRADLSRANLSDADLFRANLSDTNLSDVARESFRQDFIAEVMKVADDLETLRQTIMDGKINGSMYADDENGCSCLCGTIARIHNVKERGEDIPVNGFSFRASSNSPREKWFSMIMPGQTPNKNFAAKAAVEWIDQAISMRDHIRGGKSA